MTHPPNTDGTSPFRGRASSAKYTTLPVREQASKTPRFYHGFAACQTLFAVWHSYLWSANNGA